MDWGQEVTSSNREDFEIGSIWGRSSNLRQITNDFVSLLDGVEFDAIAGIEMKGVIYASALSERLGLPLLVFRKQEKIRHTENKISSKFVNWRNEADGIEIEEEYLRRYPSIVVVDDLIKTFSSMKAVHAILKNGGSRIVAFMCFANLSKKNRFDGIPIFSLIHV